MPQTEMQLTEAKKKTLRNTVAGNALYANELRTMMPVFKEVSLELALMSERLFKVATCTDPEFNTCDDVRRARDEVAEKMIRLMQKWKTA
jgi:division protein CdvB (Snf7/Vps24/ESCRT-III family)